MLTMYKISKLRSCLGVAKSQSRLSEIARQFAHSSSDEDDVRDPKAYRTWVEDALKGAKPETNKESQSLEEVLGLRKAESDVPADSVPAEAESVAEEILQLQPEMSPATVQVQEDVNVQEIPENTDAVSSRSAEESLTPVKRGPERAVIQSRLAPEEAVLAEAEGQSLLPSAQSSELTDRQQGTTRLTVREPEALLQGLPAADTGYREIASTSFRARHVEDLQLSQGRKFRPGDVYDAEDLIAKVRSWEEKPWLKAYKQTTKATNPVALRETDFRNISFLHKFTSETGNLPARRVTRLQKKVHSHVMRNIKTARTMGLMPRMGKIPALMPPFDNRKQ